MKHIKLLSMVGLIDSNLGIFSIVTYNQKGERVLEGSIVKRPLRMSKPEVSVPEKVFEGFDKDVVNDNLSIARSLRDTFTLAHTFSDHTLGVWEDTVITLYRVEITNLDISVPKSLGPNLACITSPSLEPVRNRWQEGTEGYLWVDKEPPAPPSLSHVTYCTNPFSMRQWLGSNHEALTESGFRIVEAKACTSNCDVHEDVQQVYCDEYISKRIIDIEYLDAQIETMSNIEQYL